MVKQIPLDMETADLNYHATMGKTKGVSLKHKKRKETIRHFVGLMFALRCVLGFVYKITIDSHVTGRVMHLNLFDWLFKIAFQPKLYVGLCWYTLAIDWFTSDCVVLQFKVYVIGHSKYALEN